MVSNNQQYKRHQTVKVLLPNELIQDNNFSAAAVKDVTKLMKLNDFLFESHMDNVNLFKLIQYCQRSEISRKVINPKCMILYVHIYIKTHDSESRGQEETAIIRETKNTRPLSELFTRKFVQKFTNALVKPP